MELTKHVMQVLSYLSNNDAMMLLREMTEKGEDVKEIDICLWRFENPTAARIAFAAIRDEWASSPF